MKFIKIGWGKRGWKTKDFAEIPRDVGAVKVDWKLIELADNSADFFFFIIVNFIWVKLEIFINKLCVTFFVVVDDFAFISFKN